MFVWQAQLTVYCDVSCWFFKDMDETVGESWGGVVSHSCIKNV